MAKVIAPSIFITNNYETIKKYFIDSFGSLNSLPENDGSLLITPKNNSYLESFEYSVNYDKPDMMCLNLTLIDIDNTLESRLFINRADHLNSQALQAINANPSSTEGIYQAIQILDSQHIFYVSFGVGFELSDWSDPRSFYLYKVVLDVTNTGIRKYKLSLYPSNNVLFKPRLKYNIQNPNQEREFLFTRSSANIFATTPIIKGESASLILYKLLKKYIRIICNIDDSLIIGIMPELSDLSVSSRSETGQVTTSSLGFGKLEGPSLDAFKQTFGLSIKTLEDATLGLFEQLTTATNGMTPMSTQEATLELAGKFQASVSSFWGIESKKVKNGLNPELPDWFLPINKINTGLKSLLTKSSLADDLVVTEENNAKLIKLWIDFGLIPKSDPLPKRVVIFGLELMIDQYLYNATQTGNAQATLSKAFSTSKTQNNFLKIVNETNEKILQIEQEKYFKKYLQVMSKKKISSDFGETLAVDELAIDDPDKNFNYLKNIGDIQNILKNFDIPVFTNNIKNSNILQLSMDNSDQYFAGLNIGIRSNAVKFYFDALQNNLNSLNLGNVQLSSVFDEYCKLIKAFAPLIEEYTGKSFVATNSPNFVNLDSGFDSIYRIIKEIIIEQISYAKKISKGGDGSFLSNIPKDFTTLNTEEQLEVISNSNLLESPDYNNVRVINDGKSRTILPTYGVGLGKRKKIFEKIKQTGLLEQFGKLILESNGNLDYEKLLFALAERRLTISSIRPSYSFEYYKDKIENYWEATTWLGPKRKDVDTNKDKYNSDKENYDWYVETASLKRQQDNFSYANIMFALYKPEVSQTRSDNAKSYSQIVHNYFFNFIPKNFDLSQDAIMAEIAKYTANQTYKLTLKTLPFFHVDSARMYMFKPCLVLSKRLKAVNVNSNLNISQFDFFTGVYNIYGFKHVITPTDCYSLFALIKKTGSSIGL